MPNLSAYELGKSLKDDFVENGAVKAPGIIDTDLLKRCKETYEKGLVNPSPMVMYAFKGTKHETFIDNANAVLREDYVQIVKSGPFAEFLRGLWDSENVYFYAEEIFSKEGGECGRTPWHQDTTYLPWGGNHWVNFWIPFQTVPRENALEVVKGSHHGPLYDGSSFNNPDDHTEPLFGNGVLDRLPDIEAERAENPDSWSVLGWSINPGDALILHPHCLHGGAKLSNEHPKRQTLVFRFFGDDATFRSVPAAEGEFLEAATDYDSHGPMFRDDIAHLRDGDPYRADIFPQLS